VVPINLSATNLSTAMHRPSLRDRAFAVAEPCAWNGLPQFITDCL